MKKLKQERGSITLFVLIAMLFFAMFLVGLYILSTNQEATQIAGTTRIKEIYEQDINQIDAVYERINKENIDIANPPKLTKGMTPIKWNGTTWVDTTKEDKDWYDYTNKQWANVRLEDGSMFVWIPRYAYRITSGWHSNTTGAIEIEFLKGDTNAAISGNTIQITTTSGQNNWLVSPGFYWDHNNNGIEDDKEALTGIWVAKYEASNHAGKLQVKSGVTSWRNIDISDCFNVCITMNSSEHATTYGLSTNKEVVEPHLMKNTEWGIVSYLAISEYGKHAEVSANTSSSYITGVGGMAASTTGNMTGIFDMSGGANECMAAYLNNDTAKNNTNINSIVAAQLKYKDVYQSAVLDTRSDHYEANKEKYGDALYEVSTTLQESNSLWDKGYMQFPYATNISIFRGGYESINASLFTFYDAMATGAGTGNSFRPTIVVLK